jgi:hypothetical protein
MGAPEKPPALFLWNNFVRKGVATMLTKKEISAIRRLVSKYDEQTAAEIMGVSLGLVCSVLS